MKPYGCHSKQRESGYWTKQRHYYPDGSYDLIDKRIPDTMTKECNYRKTTPDERCEGCTCP